MFPSSSAALVGFAFYFLFAAVLVPSVAARFASIQFSQVNQCGNFTIAFQGGKAPAALPLTLSVLPVDRKSTRLNSSHSGESRMPSSA